MAFDLPDISELLESPRESLGVELKQWIDPSTKEGKAKIAKGCIALRNNNGGILIVGVRNDGLPDSANTPDDIPKMFHEDVIQAIIAKHSSDPFEVSITHRKHRQNDYVIISVPSGVKTPVVCKSGIELENSTPILKSETVYVRTISSNNTVSSSEPRLRDWDTLVSICFDNREADIGAFIRRHLSGISADEFCEGVWKNVLQPATLAPEDMSTEFLSQGFNRYSHHGNGDSKIGTREASLVIVCEEYEPPDLSRELLWRLGAAAPRHTGWPPWVGLMHVNSEESNANVIEEGWETSFGSNGNCYNFWRIGPGACFYQLRGLEDDFRKFNAVPKPEAYIDFLLQISRTAEILSTSLSFAQTMGFPTDRSTLAIAMRWRNLEGRELASWVEPGRDLYRRVSASQNEITTTITLPADTAPQSLTPYVEKLVNPLFNLFKGTKIDTNVIEPIVLQTIRTRV
ncbi:AlbA family DNA-binding domain-containing protein [Rubinisphaera brasiliensis]|uniref:AAA-4 family protein n=1 Tax=Rubinisphaera brasiliensis (strain ATCC 49424 / DSM 5305 / JCM 21570 / IAM 15109 / NBRC 103401 / IFAM 1448) TaxID=756272 RepID=F0SNH5_RUBBR|nr:ATP-binding protein [Rubinisphaera brasiliensis]ADY57809.1 AAA-4 family protein [Rubinisphaera brasiliensis DSM 5305]